MQPQHRGDKNLGFGIDLRKERVGSITIPLFSIAPNNFTLQFLATPITIF
jgi:hypothetical protein